MAAGHWSVCKLGGLAFGGTFADAGADNGQRNNPG